MLRALVDAGGPVTIVALNDTLGGHPNTVRAQLRGLVGAGFATEVSPVATGRGRPALTFEATLAGNQVAMEVPGRDDHAALVAAVAEQIAEVDDPVAAAHALGRAWGRRVAVGGDDLVGILGAQGFTPQPTAGGLALRTCPLLDAAQQFPDVVCGIHQGLIDALSPEPMELLPFAAPGACLVRPRSTGEDPPDRVNP